MNNLLERDSKGIRQRKVLIEKYRSNRMWMMDWIKEQKNKIVRNQQFEEAVNWRHLERYFYNIEKNEEKYHLRQDFDDIFFYLYERI